MYSVLAVHIHQVLNATNPATDVQPYIRLIENFRKVDVSSDAKFQRDYRRYWQLNPARLSESFLNSYFHLLQQSKYDPHVSVEAVARKLYAARTHGNERRTLQFSFSSKLVHTVRPQAPVYDSNVDAFFFFPKGPQKNQLKRSLNGYRRFSHS